MASTEAGNVGIKISADGSQLRAELLASRKAVEANAAAMQSAASRIQSSANAMNAYGVSAKQTAAAMRGVPAQITDIVTALQGGQRPMTVLFQQGGQLKDMFGGIVPAARALGATVLGMVNPFTIGAAAVGALGVAFFKGQAESRALAKSLIETGNAAGQTAGQLAQMAARIGQGSAAVSQSAAADAIVTMVQSAKVGGDALERYTTIALRLQQVGGRAVEQTAKDFAALAQDPLQATLKLNDGANYLTQTVLRQIEALQRQGDTVGAARVAMEAYASASDNMATKLQGNLGVVERAWNAVAGAAKSAWSGLLSIGRADTAEQSLSAMQERIAAVKAEIANGSAGNAKGQRTQVLQSLQAELGVLERQRATLQQQVNAGQAAAKADADRKQAVQALAAYDQLGLEYLTKQQRMAQEIAKARQLAKQAGVSDAELQQRIADIQAKYADKAKSNVADLNKARRELEAQQQLLAQLNGLSGSFAQDWDRLTALYKAGKLSVQQLEGAQANLLAQQPAMRQMQQAMEAQARAAEHQQHALERAAQATAELKSRTAQANGNNQLADQMALQAELIRYQRAGANVVDLDAYRQAAQAQISYNDLQRQQQAIYDALNTKQEALSAAQESGAINGLQYSAQEHASRLQASADLQAIVQQMAVLATVSGNADMARAAAASAAALQRLQSQLSETGQQARDALENNFTSAFTSFISGTENARTAFAKMTAGILQDLASIAMRKALSGAFTSGGGWIGAIIDGFKASGGPVSAGGSYIVGEQGPELFVPGASGTIVPNNALQSGSTAGGSVTVQVNVDAGQVSTASNGPDMAQLGNLIGNKCLQVIADQKRPGGLLAKAA